MSDTNTVLNVNRLIGCTNRLNRRINRVNRKIKNSNNKENKDIDYINDFLVNTFQEDGSFVVSPYIDINDKTLGSILDNELSRTHNVLEQKLNKELNIRKKYFGRVQKLMGNDVNNSTYSSIAGVI